MLYDNSDYNSKVNNENQNLNFGCEGYQLFQGFFFVVGFQFVGIDQLRGTNF